MPGIDDIVEMILKEARGRNLQDPVSAIYQVMRIIENQIIGVVCNIKEEERRKEEDEQEKHTQAKEAGQKNTD